MLSHEKPSFKFGMFSDLFNQPLVVWINPPGTYADMTPQELRFLAQSLSDAAFYADVLQASKSKTAVIK